ncbi:MAG: LysR substrate-binding domain-containing protein [Alphaproteobacteria bacterium]
MATLELQVVGEDVRLTGTVRLTAPDDISERLLPERLAASRETYPGILLEMIVVNRFLNLSRRDAGVAFRPSRDPGDTLVS